MDLYVKNFPLTIEEYELRKLFKSFNPENLVIIRDKKTHVSLGYGFVKINDISSAKRAIEELNGTVFHEKILTVSEAKPRKNSGSSWKSTNEKPEDIEYKNKHVKIKNDYYDSNLTDLNKKDINAESQSSQKAKFTKTESNNGLIKINFKKE